METVDSSAISVNFYQTKHRHLQKTEVYMHARRSVKSNYQLHHVCLSICPPVYTEQLGSHWTDFH